MATTLATSLQYILESFGHGHDGVWIYSLFNNTIGDGMDGNAILWVASILEIYSGLVKIYKI